MLRPRIPTRNGALRLLLPWVIALIAGACFVWTIGLVLLTIAPAATVNWVMDTQHFDNGTFWLLSSLPGSLQASSIAGLSVLALGYLSVVLRVLSWSLTIPKRVAPWGPNLLAETSVTRVVSFERIKASTDRVNSSVLHSVTNTFAKLFDTDSSTRKTAVRTINVAWRRVPSPTKVA